MVSHGAFDATKMCALGVRASGVSIDPAGTDTTTSGSTVGSRLPHSRQKVVACRGASGSA